MSDHTASRGLASLSTPPPIEVELLWHRFIVHVADDDARRALRVVRLGVTQDVRPEATCGLTVLGSMGSYETFDNGDLLERCESPGEVAGALIKRMHRRAFELAALKGWLRIHGAVLSVGQRRIAVVGPSGAGKTTLVVAALVAGHQVEADESFLFSEGTSIGVPRRLHVEDGTFDLIPEARAWTEDAPMLSDDPPVVALDPTELGHRWHARRGELDAVVMIGSGSDHALRRMSTADALPLLVGQALPTIESRSAVARHLAALTRSTPVYRVGGWHGASPQALLEVLAQVPAHR